MRRAPLAVAMSVALIGVTAGPASAQSLTPSSATFPALPLGGISAPQAFTLTGGPPPFGISSRIAITPLDNSGFSSTDNCPSNGTLVAPNTCTINVVFNPILTPFGLRTATLNANHGMTTASLAGTALPPSSGKKCKKKGKGAAVAKKKCKKKKKR